MSDVITRSDTLHASERDQEESLVISAIIKGIRRVDVDVDAGAWEGHWENVVIFYVERRAVAKWHRW